MMMMTIKTRKKPRAKLLFGVDANGNDLNAFPETENLPELPKEKPSFELSSLLRQESDATNEDVYRLRRTRGQVRT